MIFANSKTTSKPKFFRKEMSALGWLYWYVDFPIALPAIAFHFGIMQVHGYTERFSHPQIIFTTQTTVLNGQSLPGLGMNIARYNAGACSWNTIGERRMVVSKTITPFRQIEGYWLDGKSEDPQSSSWSWRDFPRPCGPRGARWPP